MTLLGSHSIRKSVPSILIPTKSTWPAPEQSIGRECSKINGLRCWEVTGPALDIMNQLSVLIKDLLDKHQEILEQGELKPRAISFHMWMIGSAANAANPTIVFSSKSRRQRTFAKVLLKESKLLSGHPGINIKTLDKAPAIYQAAEAHLDTEGNSISDHGIYMVDDSRGTCGSLVAFGSSRLATMGGVILIDGVHYGISAQHTRSNYLRDRQLLKNEPGDVLCFDDDSDSEYCDLIEYTSKGSESSDSDYASLTGESLTSGSTEADSIFEPPYTSLAMDEVGLEAEDTIYTPQGQLFCNQRIADIPVNYMQTDLDYEVFRLDDPRFHTVNQIALPTMQGPAQTLRPSKPARMPADTAVWVFTGTTGAVQGTMTSTAHYMKMEGSKTFQEMWAVRLDRETRPGDCGAWVIDAVTGSIYGHIIAGDLTSSTAYIIPAYKIFDDIEDRFGVPPLLPSEPALKDSTTVANDSIQPSANFTNSKLAIVGMPGRFPKAANSESLWELLEKGIDRQKVVPKGRFNEAHIDPTGQRKNICHTRPYALLIDEPRLFDARFFGMSPREITQTDPRQRLALVTAYEALEVSGYIPNRTSLKFHRSGTFHEQTRDDWREINQGQDIDTYLIPDGLRALADTGCSSNVLSLQFAMNLGMNDLSDTDTLSGLSHGQFLSKTGSCQASNGIALTTKLHRIGTFDGQTNDDWEDIRRLRDINTYVIPKWVYSDLGIPGSMEVREAIKLPFRALSLRDQLETNGPTHPPLRWNPLHHVDSADTALQDTTEQAHVNANLGKTMDERVFVRNRRVTFVFFEHNDLTFCPIQHILALAFADKAFDSDDVKCAQDIYNPKRLFREPSARSRTQMRKKAPVDPRIDIDDKAAMNRSSGRRRASSSTPSKHHLDNPRNRLRSSKSAPNLRSSWHEWEGHEWEGHEWEGHEWESHEWEGYEWEGLGS